ncbi:hypothetical protein [Sulfurihydrogenibium sp.]|uniref:hypothetical protein n=1 Tax=Sulfurihydrogenibium sp. TaxID=2053621 RepID=UPI0026242448|nr:hypothetical protein [Sulfurihydrogenibium sp.]
MKDVLELLGNQIKLNRLKENVYYTDIGYGEKFLTLSLPIYNLNSLVNYSSLQIMKELIRRFIDINSPKGFRTRFFVYHLENEKEFLEVYNNLNKDNILYNIDLKYAGCGYNFISFYKFLEEDIKKFLKVVDTTGLDITVKNIKKTYNPDIKTLIFLIDEDDLFIEKLDKSYFSPNFINKTLNLIVNFISRVL